MISFAKIKSDTFLLVWNIASVVTFVLPLFAFSVARLTSDRDWNEDQNDNDNNQYQNNYENPDYYDEYGNYIGPNHWWEFWKKNNNNGNDGDDGDDENGYEFRTPWWYIWGENEEREPEEESGAVLFIYLWTLVLLAGLFYVGNTMGMIEKKIESLRWALLGFLNYCFVTIVLLIGIEDAIETEGREMEETGFYGQRAVLLLVTCMLGMLQSIAFISWTTKRINKIKIESLSEKTDEYVGIEFEKDTTAGTLGYKAPV